MDKKSLKEKVYAIRKEIGVMTRSQENPFYKSLYFDINDLVEHIEPILEKYSVMITQPLTVVGGRTAVKTIIEDMESDMVVETLALLPDNIDAQKMGGAITFLRRYSLKSYFFLREVDDDANHASNAKPKYVAPTGTIPLKTRTIQNPLNDLPFIS